jgi:chromate transport protein ChrA
MGCYIVAVGYAAGGWSGAVAGWVAMSAPALLALPIMTFLHTRARAGRWRDATDAVVLASAALVLATASSLIPIAIVDGTTAVIAIAALAAVFLTRIPTTWLLVGGATGSVMRAWLN